MGRILIGAGITSLLLTGCSTPPAESPGACGAFVRRDGITYEGKAPTERAATELGHADQAACADVGEDPRGVFFPEDPKQVQVWSFEGLDPRKVVGARGTDEALYFYIAEDVPNAEADRISGALSIARETDD